MRFASHDARKRAAHHPYRHPRDEPDRGRPAGRQLDLHGRAPAPVHTPRRKLLDDLDDAAATGAEDDVDREAHPERVNAAEGVVQQEALVRFERGASDQPAGAAPGQRRCDLEPGDEHAIGDGAAEFGHAGSVGRNATTVVRRPQHGSARGLHACERDAKRLTPLRYALRVDEDFRSGDDIELAFLGRTYAFSHVDFEQRVVRAALDLRLAQRPVRAAAKADLVEAATFGDIEHPRSDAGRHLAELITGDGEDPVYWLRKLVFRSAWLDHRIKHGLIDVAFDDATGTFRIEPGRYPLPGTGHPTFAVHAEDRS